MNKFLALLIPAVIAVVSMKSTEALPTDQRLSNDNTARASSSLDWLNPFTWFSGKRERRNNEDMRVSVIQQQHPKKIRRRLGVNDKLAFAAQQERPHDAKVVIVLDASQIRQFCLHEIGLHIFKISSKMDVYGFPKVRQIGFLKFFLLFSHSSTIFGNCLFCFFHSI